MRVSPIADDRIDGRGDVNPTSNDPAPEEAT
jgi:hypothetical protein